MARAVEISRIQGEIMMEAQEINEDAKFLSKLAQEQSAARKLAGGV